MQGPKQAGVIMKKTEEDKRLVDRLKPSKFSAEGFLGSDFRDAEEIIAEDLRILERSGTTAEELAQALRDIHDLAKAGFGNMVVVGKHLTAVFIEVRGHVPSPFPGDGSFEKGETVLTNTRSKEEIRLSDLSLHLIATRGFFQGLGSPYRIDPAKAMRVFGLPRPG